MDFRRNLAAVALTSMCVLLLQLALTRLFSATMYYHFAFLAISVALFGGATAGVAVYLREEKLDRDDPRWMAWAAILFGVTTVMALGTVLRSTLDLEGNSIAKVAGIYVASALPFFFAGCVIALAVRRFAARMSTLYLFDLVGAGAGCLLLIPLIQTFGVIQGILVIAVAGAAAALFIPFRGRGEGAARAVAVLLLVAFAFANAQSGFLRLGRQKDVDLGQALFSRWNSFSHVAVMGDFDSRQLKILIDADAMTLITRNAGGYKDRPVPTIEGLVHYLAPRSEVLIVGPGGGNDIMLARLFGSRVTGVEVNPLIARDVMMSEPFRSWSGRIYEQPDVDVHVDDGRSFIRSSGRTWNVIQLNMVDTWAATAAGAFALSENNLYTVEAFRDYIRHLEPDGLLSFTRWYFEPPDQLQRVLTVLREAAAREGIADVSGHVLAFRYAGDAAAVPATVIFRKRPYTPRELAAMHSIADRIGLVTLYTPLRERDSRFGRLLSDPDPEALWASLPTDVSPTTDNDPFFFNSVRLGDLGSVARGMSEWRKTNLGTWVLFVLLGVSFLMASLFVLIPLLWARRRGRAAAPPLRTILYFAALGAGFIVIEVVLVQKFVLLLGHPVYAVTVVLFSILTFSGIGSWLSGKLADERLASVLPLLVIGVAATAAIYAIVLSPIIDLAVALSRPARIAVAVALLAPLSLLLGTPMPSGIRLMARERPDAIAWAWGVNGALSVFGSIAALAIALVTGFNQALLVGAACYVIAFVFVRSGSAAATRSSR